MLFTVGGPDSGRIGDNLCMLPFMLTAAQDYGSVQVRGMNPAVAELIHPSVAFSFVPYDVQVNDGELLFNVSVMHALYGQQLHMIQSYYRHFSKTVPELPLTVEFSQTGGLPRRSAVVVAPYSWSDSNGNKLWAHSNWVSVIERLRAANVTSEIYVVGSQPVDDPQVYEEMAITPFFGRSLADVLALIRSASLFLSVDNGLSHLAHLGGVSHHVLLYPGCLAACWVPNPRGVMVCNGPPSSVSVDDILRAAYIVLDRG
jgi:ADP-heptose:LPS heptosyltransferase